jgi:NADH:quinone reductase (non-electrogenic)
MAETKPAVAEPGASATVGSKPAVAPPGAGIAARTAPAAAAKPPPIDLSQWNRKTAQDETDLHRVVVVGGGAAGLELATALGDKLARKVHVTLIERTRTHFWKPHLHEIAAGSMDMGIYETNYLSHAYRHHFRYRIGEMVALDRARREVLVAPYIDEDGRQVTPPRRFSYDTLVISIGSMTNDFGTPGARDYAISMETPAQAERFHRQLVDAFLRAHAQAEPIRPEQLEVAIIGAGATGVELAAELHNTTRALVSYGFDRINPDEDIRITLIEAADRILPALPPRLSEGASHLLSNLNINVRTSAKVAEVLPNGVKLANGEVILAELVVWAAGVKAPPMLQDLDGLESNRINQLVVLPTLQTTRDPNVFAIGDCAACPWYGKPGALVPPRAQAAHQQASLMVKQIRNRLAGKPLAEFKYKDFGSLVSLGEHSTVGNLMGAGRNIWISGQFAKLMYLSLYKMHELALHGFLKVSLDTAGRFLSRSTEPHIKLH